MFKLSNKEQIAFLNLCETAQEVNTVDDFKAWLSTHVREFFPFGMMVAVLGSIHDEIIFVELVLTIDYPDNFLSYLQRETQLSDRPMVARWFQEREPQIINEHEAVDILSPFEMERLRVYGQKNLAIHGLIDLHGEKGSYFSFARIPGELTEWHKQKLKIMVPQLHQAICKLQPKPAPTNTNQKTSRLSQRQQEILNLVAQGKTNREIALALQRSESTIRNHVHTILASLGVSNRAQATARMMQIGSDDL